MGQSSSSPAPAFDPAPFSDHELEELVRTFVKWRGEEPPAPGRVQIPKTSLSRSAWIAGLRKAAPFLPGSALFDRVATFGSGDDSQATKDELPFAAFHRGLGSLVKGSPRTRLREVVALADPGADLGRLGEESVSAVFALCWQMCAGSGVCLGPKKAGPDDSAPDIGALVECVGAAKGGFPVRFVDFQEWVDDEAPCLPDVLSETLSRAVLPPDGPEAAGPGRHGPPGPETPSRLLPAPAVLLLLHSSAAARVPWRRLYCSAENGLSFNRLEHHLHGYAGPTVLVVRSRRGHVLGGLASQQWRELSSCFGDARSLLFSAAPCLRIYRPGATRAAENNFQYMNRSSAGRPHGIGMGGTSDSARLWLDDGFIACHAKALDLTFAMGPLLWRAPGQQEEGGDEFAVDAIEAWGLGGTEADAAQARAQKDQKNFVERARKVDRGKFLESDFDKEMFFGNTFATGADHRKDGGPDQQQQ